MQQYAVYILFYCNITLHVSGAVHTHHQECIKLTTASGTSHIIYAATSLQRGQWPLWSEVAA